MHAYYICIGGLQILAVCYVIVESVFSNYTWTRCSYPES